MAYAFGDGEYDAFKAAVDRAIPNYGSLPLFAAAEVPRRIEEANKRLISPPSSAVLSLALEEPKKLSAG